MKSKALKRILSSEDCALMLIAIEKYEPMIAPNTVINGIDVNGAFASAKSKLNNRNTVFTYNETSAVLTALQQLRDDLQHQLSLSPSGTALHKKIMQSLAHSQTLISAFLKVRK